MSIARQIVEFAINAGSSDIHLEEENPQVYIHPDWKVKHSRWVDIPGCAVTLLKKFQKEKVKIEETIGNMIHQKIQILKNHIK